MSLALAITILTRVLLVALFLPFSALDKLLNFKGAVAQAREAVRSDRLAALLIVAGLAIEVAMSAAILAGIADRAAALVLSGYCVVTAVLWKQFWTPGDFWSGGPAGRARALFWDFWKNLALAGGFLLLTFGPSASTAKTFFAAPLASSHPYQVDPGRP
jgi:putative oxidoreductase